MNKFLIDYKKLLQGRYEAERLPKDFSSERTVPDFAFNILNQAGLLYRPVIDEHHLENRGKKPIWPDNKTFAVCLTHDVDAVSAYSLNQCIRKRMLKFRTNTSLVQKTYNFFGAGLEFFNILKQAGRKDPYQCFEKWLSVENEIGARSTFFFWPGLNSVSRNHYSDCHFNLSDLIEFDSQKCSISEMIREIDHRGWEIGLHPSWYSFNDADELKRQKEALETVLGHDVVSIRQHFLHYDIRITPRVHSEVGFKYDSSLGFNDNVGFRLGTCYPRNLYDLVNEQDLPIMELPLIIQDGALLNPKKGMRLDAEMAFSYVKQLTSEVEKVGGVLTLIWHPNHIDRTEWWELYNRSLEYLKTRNPWFGTIKEIGEWWSNTSD